LVHGAITLIGNSNVVPDQYKPFVFAAAHAVKVIDQVVEGYGNNVSEPKKTSAPAPTPPGMKQAVPPGSTVTPAKLAEDERKIISLPKSKL
jgi:hypothetical protein